MKLKSIGFRVAGSCVLSTLLFVVGPLGELSRAEDQTEDSESNSLKRETDVEQTVSRLSGFYFRAGLGLGSIEDSLAISSITVGFGYQIFPALEAGIYLDSLGRASSYFDFDGGIRASNLLAEVLIYPIPKTLYFGGRTGGEFLRRSKVWSSHYMLGPVVGVEIPLNDSEKRLTLGLEASYLFPIENSPLEEGVKLGMVQGMLKYRF